MINKVRAYIKKYNLLDAPESWLKNHPYFRYYADKIVYLRVTFTNEKEIFKYSGFCVVRQYASGLQ